MKWSRLYSVYIMASKSKRIYIGVTNDLERRVYEHKNKENDGFTAKYNMNRLVYFEDTDDISDAIQREKTLKKWLRKWKIELIETDNPNWEDLAEDWY